MTTTTRERPRMTVLEAMETKDPRFMAGCARIASSIRADLERLVDLEPGHPDLIDRDDDGAVLEVHHPDAIRAVLEAAYSAPAADRPEPIDWGELQRFLQAIGRDRGPLVLSLFPPDPSKPCIHVPCDAEAMPKQWIEQRQQRQPELALGLVMNHPLDKPADWGSKPEHLNRAGKVRAWGATKGHISHAVGIWAECDGGLPLEAQQALPELACLPEPSLAVWSGSKSLHLYWLLAPGEVLAPATFEALQRRLAQRLAEVAPEARPDCSISNVNRVMRAPGGTHPKTGNRCRIHNASEQRFTVAQLQELLPEPEQAAAPAAPAPGPADAVPVAQLLPRDQLRAWEQGVSEGQRNSTAFSLACQLLALHEAAAATGLATSGNPEDALLEFASRCTPPLPEQEVVSTFRSACSAPRTTDPGWPERLRFQLNRRAKQDRHQQAPATRPPQQAEGQGQLPPAAEPSPAVAVSRKTRVGSDEVLTLLPYHLGELRLNVRSGEVHSSARGVISANEIGRMYLELSKPFEVWPKEGTADGITLLASRNPFDPVAEYLETLDETPLPMEQWHRLDQQLLGIDDPIAAAFLPRYFISGVARVFKPGAYVRQVPVLIGSQERGKGELGRILFGAANWVEGVGSLDRDALMKCHTAWGVELAELDGVTRRADQEHLKAFITEVADTYRKPYDRSSERHERRFVFWGTSNRPPLRDSTGSTRFVCIPIPDRPLPLEWARQHRDALWARALQQYRSGVTWLRTSEEERRLVEERNNDFTELDPWADPVAEFLQSAARVGELPVRVPKVLDALEVPVERQNTAAAKRVREIAERLGWVHGRRRFKGNAPTQGLWPKEEAVHPDHPPCTPPCTPAETSEAERSEPAVHPDHPYSQTLGKQIGGEQGEGAGRGQGGEVRKVLDSEGCTPCTHGQTDCGGVDLSESGGVHRGVHAPSTPSTVIEWVELALGELRLAPAYSHLPEVAGWLKRQPGAPAISQTQLAGAMERLRHADQESDQLGLEVSL